MIGLYWADCAGTSHERRSMLSKSCQLRPIQPLKLYAGSCCRCLLF